MTNVRQERFFNREWSWLRFNERVLEEAADESNPLLERLKFLAIFASNLDEFFMIRVAGLYRQLEAGIAASGPGKRSPAEQLEGVAQITHRLVADHGRVTEEVLARLAERGVRLVGVEQLDGPARDFVDRYYDEVIYPVLTPMVVSPAHPFPRLSNCTLYLALNLERPRANKRARSRLGFLALPRVLPRFVVVRRSAAECVLVPIESILVVRAAELFAGYRLRSLSAVRVTRDADFDVDEEAAEDLRRAISKKLLGRRHGAAVRLEHGARIDARMLARIDAELEVDERHHYPRTSLMQAADLMQIYGDVDRPDLKDQPLPPLSISARPQSIFDWLKRGPQLFHHPYHAFDPVAELVEEAAADPHVLAIKQCLYRTSGDSPVIRALTAAAEAGKQVTVVVELRARFDEERNIEWARRLEQAGAHVVYGLVGLKTHSKALLVVRREPEGIRRYVHFGTGNYNDATARIYTDLGLMACDDLLGEDASALFNVITGATEPPRWNKVEVAPTGLRRFFLGLIEREIEKSARRSRGHIVAKMNSLSDREVIDALYRASLAGVRVDLIVRGICCLRPGVPGLSDNIRVRSVVGRFLEHARIFWFRNGGEEELYLGSADWMPRNLDHRIELVFPVEDPAHVDYIKSVLELHQRDSIKARDLRPEGEYVRQAREDGIDSQIATYDLTRRLVAQLNTRQGGQVITLRERQKAGWGKR